MSENETKDAEKNNEENIEVEPLSDQELDTVSGGTLESQDDGTSNICSALWCS
jgi:hypothetical protein